MIFRPVAINLIIVSATLLLAGIQKLQTPDWGQSDLIAITLSLAFATWYFFRRLWLR